MTPYYQDDKARIYNESCVRTLQRLEDDSIDVVSLLAAIIVAMAIAGFTMLRRASDAIVEDGEDEDSDYSKDEY